MLIPDKIFSNIQKASAIYTEAFYSNRTNPYVPLCHDEMYLIRSSVKTSIS